jgi:hypothetical protein
MNNMSRTFTTKISDDKQRRIVIDKISWELEDLKKGDYLEVTINKIKKKTE